MEKELRFQKHDVTFTNQQIIEFAYITRDLISPLIKERSKLFSVAANCYQASFYHVRRLLKTVPAEYLAQHATVIEFYAEKRELSYQRDRLSWESSKAVVIKSDCVPSDGPCGICGTYTKNQPGPGLYIEGSCWEPVCYKCGSIHCTDLVRLLELSECQNPFQ